MLRSPASNEAAAIEIVRAKDIPPAPLDLVECEHNDLYPAGEEGRLKRRFRNAWRRAGAALPAVDMPEARTIRMNEVRSERTPRLTKCERDIVLAQAKGQTTLVGNLLTYRQTLLDLPATERPKLDARMTPSEVDTFVPTWPVDPAI